MQEVKEVKEGWKILRKGRLSCSVGRNSTAKAQRYLKGVPTRRRKGWLPLTCFADLRHARKLLRDFQGGSAYYSDEWKDTFIVKCQYIPSEDEDKPSRMVNGASYCTQHILLHGVRYPKWPYGTTFADEITCIE